MRIALWLCFLFFIPMGFAHQNVLLQHIDRLEYQSVTYDFFKYHQLLFFFASTCPHCHKVAPSLKTWATAHQANVMAVSFDGQLLPEFSHVMDVSEALIQTAFRGQPITFPALFVMNTKTNRLYPAMMGEWTLPELGRRLDVLIEKIKRYEGEYR